MSREQVRDAATQGANNNNIKNYCRCLTMNIKYFMDES